MRYRWVAVLVAVVAGCSSGSSADPSEAGLEAAATEWTEAFLDEPGDTYDLLSARCHEEWRRGDWAANVAGGLMMMQAFGMSFDGVELGEVTVKDFTEGESGVVLVELLDEDGQPWSDDPGDGQPWVFEDGWRVDDCEEFDLEADE